MKRQLPSQLLEEQFLGLSTRRAALSHSIRLGAQLMLQKAIELEVTEFLGRDHYQRSGDGVLQGYRNGSKEAPPERHFLTISIFLASSLTPAA